MTSGCQVHAAVQLCEAWDFEFESKGWGNYNDRLQRYPIQAPTIPPSIEKKNPETEIASPPQSTGSMLPRVEPTKSPIQINFLVILALYSSRFAQLTSN
ncbi:MAG: hypothetical protein DMG14_20085 [Acidobacteria bacterium]|nr:MAG: hypothetical protein DMG14_20085 [Acidobacteriota bacterium]